MVSEWFNNVDEFVWISFFFFKQKTAYEMRISDWSSDVCSSDLDYFERRVDVFIVAGANADDAEVDVAGVRVVAGIERAVAVDGAAQREHDIEIGRASCRERVCQYV